MPHSLRTSRLLLRPVMLRDAKPYWRAFNTPDFTQMTGSWAYPFTVDHTVARIRDRQAGGMHHWFSVLKENMLMGSALLFGEDGDAIEIGYGIAGQYAGQGLGTEVAKALCQFGFSALKKKTLLAKVSTHNPASTRILTRIGFEQGPGVSYGWSAHFGRQTPYYSYSLKREHFKI